HLAVTGSTLGTQVGHSFIATSHDGEGTVSLSVTTVPEPRSAAGMLAMAFLGLSLLARRSSG
ncbi:MAG: PEP-CTERM sorting domain-containing protein, partial [Planctomycetota bacterium]